MPRKLKVSTVRRPQVRKTKMRKNRVRKMNRRSMRSLYDDDDLGLGVADMPTTGGQGAGFQERARQNYSSHRRHGRLVHHRRSSSHRRRYH